MPDEYQKELFSLPNPCIGICQSGPGGYCIGCFRSRDERFNWHNKPEWERSDILKKLAIRKRNRALAQRRDAWLKAQQEQKPSSHQEQSPKQLQLLGL